MFNMGKYSCAIGPCNEKSYDKSEGVKFFHIQHFPEQNKLAVKRKILSTRKDISSINDIKDVKICSRHFLNGDKTNLPTIIPKLVGGQVVWPEDFPKPRRSLKRHLDVNSEVELRPKLKKRSKTDTQSGPALDQSPKLSAKLQQIKQTIAKSPPKLVGMEGLSNICPASQSEKGEY